MPAPTRRRQPIRIDDSLAAYLHDIGRYPLLTLDEELVLSRRVQAGDAQALDQLICANLRFVVSVAKPFQNQGVLLTDLINEGNLGLLRAAERFDAAKGVKFISYAIWWIRRSIFQALADHSHPVRVPLQRITTFHRIRRRTNVLRQELGRDPTAVEITAALDIDQEELDVSLRVSREALSLDAPLAPGHAGKLLDYLPAEFNFEDEEGGADLDIAASLDHALHTLRSRDADILKMYFGFDGNDPMTLEEIGAKLGVTRERVRQIKERGLSRLRKSKEIPTLLTLYAH